MRVVETVAMVRAAAKGRLKSLTLCNPYPRDSNVTGMVTPTLTLTLTLTPPLTPPLTLTRCAPLPIRGDGSFDALYVGPRVRVSQNVDGGGVRTVHVRVTNFGGFR